MRAVFDTNQSRILGDGHATLNPANFSLKFFTTLTKVEREKGKQNLQKITFFCNSGKSGKNEEHNFFSTMNCNEVQFVDFIFQSPYITDAISAVMN